jgi:peroxiredoxin
VLFALSDAGIAIAHRRDLHGDDALRLEPWARVAGTVKIDNEPGVGIELSDSPDDQAGPTSADQPRFIQQNFSRTDQAGRFEFPRVAPGRHTFGQWVPNGVAGRRWFVGMATVDAQAGRSSDLKIGGVGRAISGKLALPSGGLWMIRTASIETPGSKDGAVSRGVRVFDDGRFRGEDLPAGEYLLRIAVHEAPPGDECGWGRLIAAFSRSFTVPDLANGGPLDLGRLEPVEVGGKPLQVGETAPDFAAKTLDGQDFRLSDHRGKFVLLDFWATWCAPCMAELPNLKAVHDAFGADRRLEIVSVSLDERQADAQLVARDQKLPWRQGHLNPDSSVVAAYGATAIPATFLIGPDGKILARDLRGPRMKPAIEEALKR